MDDNKIQIYGTLVKKYYLPSIQNGISDIINVVIAFLVIFAIIDFLIKMVNSSNRQDVKGVLKLSVDKFFKIGVIITLLKNYISLFLPDLYKIATVTIPNALTGLNIQDLNSIKQLLYLPIQATILKFDGQNQQIINKIIESKGQYVGDLESPKPLLDAVGDTIKTTQNAIYDSSGKYLTPLGKGIVDTTTFVVGGSLRLLTGAANAIAKGVKFGAEWLFSDLSLPTILILLVTIMIVSAMVGVAITKFLIIIVIEQLNVLLSLAFGVVLAIGFSDLSLLSSYGKSFIKLVTRTMFKLVLLSVFIIFLIDENQKFSAITTTKNILEVKGSFPSAQIVWALLLYDMAIIITMGLYNRLSSVKW